MRRSTRESLTGLAFAAPWLAALVFLVGYPFAASLWFSLCDYPPMKTPAFVGAANYAELARDAVFRQSMLVTIAFAVVAIPLGVAAALTLAVMLSARLRGQAVYRVVFYLPHLVPSVAVAILWMWMFNPDFGMLNAAAGPVFKTLARALGPLSRVNPPLSGWAAAAAVVAALVLWRALARRAGRSSARNERTLRFASGVAGAIFAGTLVLALIAWIRPADVEKLSSPGWLTDSAAFPSGLTVAPSWALWALIFMSMWGVGQMAVIYLAKLQDVPVELYEAADLDGASWWQKLRHITLPMISPVILFNVVMGIIGAFQVFTEPYVMTGGGPEDRTRFVSMFIYDQAFLYQRLGYASAVAWVLFGVIVVLTLLALRISRERVYYAAR